VSKDTDRSLTFSLAMVWMTSSGGVPSSSVMMENWLTSGVSVVSHHTAALTVLAREKRLALEHLGKDTSRAPDVDCQSATPLIPHLARLTGNVVLLPSQHDLGSPVVPSRDVSRHLRILDPCQTKIANLA
jgi:hypothetical protein